MISFGFIQVLLISIDSIQISIDFYAFLNWILYWFLYSHMAENMCNTMDKYIDKHDGFRFLVLDLLACR